MRNRVREAIPSCLSISGWSVMDDETQSLDINWSDRSQSKPGLISNPSPLPSVQHLLSTEYQYCVSASNGQFSIGHHPILEISILLYSPPTLPINQLLELTLVTLENSSIDQLVSLFIVALISNTWKSKKLYQISQFNNDLFLVLTKHVDWNVKYFKFDTFSDHFVRFDRTDVSLLNNVNFLYFLTISDKVWCPCLKRIWNFISDFSCLNLHYHTMII